MLNQANLLVPWVLMGLSVVAFPYAVAQTVSQADKSSEYRRVVREASRNEQQTTLNLASFVEKEFLRLEFPASAKDDDSNLDSPEQYAILDALHLRAFHSISLKNAMEFERYAEVVDGKSGLRRTDIAAVYGALILARQFDRAKKWHTKLNPVARESLPLIVDQTSANVGRSVWVASQSALVLTRVAVSEKKGPRVVVVTSPRCHFSVAAMNAIAKNPALLDRLQPITDWIVPAEQSLAFLPLQAWNSEHQKIQLALVHRYSDWDVVDSWDTPQFYFLLNGKVVRRVTGWPKQEGNEAALVKAMDELDLMAAQLKR